MHDNKMLIFDWKGMGKETLDRVCRDSVAPQCCDNFPEMNL